MFSELFSSFLFKARTLKINVRAFFNAGLYIPGVLLWLALATVYFLYAPGIAPGFLFDDYTNLNVLGNGGSIDTWDSFLQLLLSGNSSSLGRLLSVSSFLLNDNAWPSSAESFKYTNVLFHLLCGALIAWLFYLVMQATCRNRKQSAMIAVIAATLWLLHPLHVSTVLYPVQRMAIMAAMFVVLGLALYVKGRLLLASNQYPVRAFTLMIVAVVVCTPLAVLSKENGVLLPLLILVMEFTVLNSLTVPSAHKAKSRLFTAVFLILPLIILAAYFIINWDQKILQQYMLRRPFTLTERLLTEPRVLIDYIGKIFLPRMQTSGLYYDNYEFSKGILEPPMTLVAIIVISAMTGLAIYLRKTLPFLSAAILFFLAGHALESTFIPLELYFEHRNYLPSIFIFLAITTAGFQLAEKTKRPAFVAGLGVILVMVLGGMTYARASLWSNIDKLALVWAMENPNAVRTQQQAAIIWQQMGQTEKAIEHMQKAVENSQDKFVLHLQELSLHCRSDHIDKNKLDKIKELARKDVFDKYTAQTYTRLMQLKTNGKCSALSYDFLETVLLAALENPWNQQLSARKQEIYYLLGWLYLDTGQHDKGKEAMFKAYDAMPSSIESGLQIVAVLATHELYNPGIELINRIDSQNERSKLDMRTARTYLLNEIRNFDEEIDRIREQLISDMARKK